MAADSKRTTVCNILRNKLRSGAYPVGSRFATESELTQELGFCKGTIREAISTLLDDGMLERRRGIGTFVVSPAPVAPRKAARLPLACLVEGRPPVGRPSIIELLSLNALHRILDPLNWQIKVFHATPDQTVEQRIGHLIATRAPEAFLLAGFTCRTELSNMIRSSGSRLVTIGRPEDAEQVRFVDTDHTAGMHDVVTRLLRRGHTQIALIDNSPSHFYSFQKRRNGYLNAFTDHGLVPDARMLLDVLPDDAEAARAAFDELLRRGFRPTAVVARGNLVSGVLNVLRERGLSIPGDISLVAYGAGEKSSCPLPFEHCTHTCWDIYPMAEQAARMLLDPDAVQEQLFPVEFRDGTSVRDNLPASDA
ncbi:MAG: GntR family transcriptional regulator [Lentisphaeria bacterium]|nr:GntR family transcriptional regulator [Lentisphaeria bacterium]